MKTETINTTAKGTPSNFFSRKIGNTTYRVSVSFSEKSKESIEDKILRLVVSDSSSKDEGGLLCS